MKKIGVLVTLFAIIALLAACSNTPKLASQTMPESGFLPIYSVLVPVASSDPDIRIWRYRKADVYIGTYKAVLLDQIYLNQNATKEISPDVINKAKTALYESLVEAVKNRGNIKVVREPGPGVARISIGITGAESSTDSLQPWDFTPVGLALNAAAYSGGVNSKTPAMLIESKLTDSQSNDLIGEGLVTVQGESFRTYNGSVDSFVEMAKKVVRVAIESITDTKATSLR